MSVVIRLKRGGRTHAPYYRIVVTDSRRRDQGREIEQIGVYHPVGRPEPIAKVDVKKALKWLYEGAQYTDTARSVLSRNGVLKAFADGVKPEDIQDVVEAAPVAEAAPVLEQAAPVETEASPEQTSTEEE